MEIKKLEYIISMDDNLDSFCQFHIEIEDSKNEDNQIINSKLNFNKIENLFHT